MKKLFIVVMAVLAAIPSGSALAKGKPTVSPQSKPTKTVATEWLLPKATMPPVKMAAGATVPLKFRLANSGTEITKTDNTVAVRLTGITCDGLTMGATSLTSAKPSAADKSNKSQIGVLRYAGNSYQYLWKLAKTTTPGCYRFQVTAPGLTLPGAIIEVTATATS